MKSNFSLAPGTPVTPTLISAYQSAFPKFFARSYKSSFDNYCGEYEAIHADIDFHHELATFASALRFLTIGGHTFTSPRDLLSHYANLLAGIAAILSHGPPPTAPPRCPGTDPDTSLAAYAARWATMTQAQRDAWDEAARNAQAPSHTFPATG